MLLDAAGLSSQSRTGVRTAQEPAPGADRDRRNGHVVDLFT
jgi:hypothetical protein